MEGGAEEHVRCSNQNRPKLCGDQDGQWGGRNIFNFSELTPSCVFTQVGLQVSEEDTMMTKEPRDWATIDSSIATGDRVKESIVVIIFYCTYVSSR